MGGGLNFPRQERIVTPRFLINYLAILEKTPGPVLRAEKERLGCLARFLWNLQGTQSYSPLVVSVRFLSCIGTGWGPHTLAVHLYRE